MATYEQIMSALRNADAAGDVAAATQLAAMARAAKAESPDQARWRAAREGTLQASPESLARHAAADAIAARPTMMQQAGDMVEAGTAGVWRGITGLADLPGMVVGGLGGLAASGMERTGLVSPDMAEGMRAAVSMTPMGDGNTFRDAAAAATGGGTEFKGNTTAGRYAGTVGEFLPGSVIGGGGLVRNALTYGVAPGLASEAAGQATEGTALEPLARALAPIVTGMAVSRLTRAPGPQAPSRDALAAQADELYRAGDARPAAQPGDVSGLRSQIAGELQNLNITTPTGRVVADGNVKKFLDVLDDYDGQQMKPEQMQTLRQILKDAAGSTEPADRRIGSILLDKFDEWRATQAPEYSLADALYGRVKRSDDIDFRIEKAENRAASSGTGGNRVNASRQNIRQILDNPKAQRGYSAAELDAMREIVQGSPLVNALRLGGRLSPTSGALPLIANIAGSAVSPGVAVPVMGAAAASKGLAEALTARQIAGLSDLIRNGGPLPKDTAKALDGLANALLVGRSIDEDERRRRQQ